TSVYDEGKCSAIGDMNGTIRRDADGCSLTEGLLDAEQDERVAVVLIALADRTRWRVLSHLNGEGCQEVGARDLTEELVITRRTVSHHMNKLVDAGLITLEQRGRWAHYSIVPEAFTQLRDLLALTYAGGIGRAQTIYPRGDQSHRRYCHYRGRPSWAG